VKTTFEYPREFVTLPDYTAHAGQEVVVVRALTRAEADYHDDPDLERMFKVRTADGWEGDVFESELPYPKGGDDAEFLAYCDRLVAEAASL